MTSFIDPILIRYIQDNPLEKRLAVAENILNKYNDRVPVIVGRAELKQTPAINKYKYLVPRDISFGRFINEVRKNIPSLDPSAALFFFLSNNTLSQMSTLMSTLYDEHKSEDKFLYVIYSSENTFG